ncbi:MAG: efflux RND transporter periplasmic adaptor subunit [Rhizobiales bacterium]|nr:efflux RND transporter periplasmic adaptor subunit [Hyphomicrobiales bacterium]
MSVGKQLFLSLLVILLAGAGWYVFEHRASLFGGEGAVTAAAPGAAGGGARRGQGGFGPTPVVTDLVASDVSSESVRAVGTVLAPRSVNVYPQVTAIVTELLFKAGDKVAKDQPLVRLDDSDQKVALDLADVALADAKKALERSQKLASTNNITQTALQDAQSAERKAEIAVLGAQIALDRRTINAPFAGVVGISDISEGDLVTPSTVVATVDDLTTLKVSFLVPERYAARIAIGQAITATADSRPDAAISGAVSAIDSRVDQAARTLKVEATLDAASATAAGVRPGMSIKVTLPFPGQEQLAVSALAIQWDRNGSYVWRVDGDGVKRAAIEVLERQSGRVLVASADLKQGDKVVVEGLQRLRDGARIAELNAQPAADAAAAKGG